MVIKCDTCGKEIKDGYWFGNTASIHCSTCAANKDIWETEKGEN